MKTEFLVEKLALEQVQSFLDENGVLLVKVNRTEARQALIASIGGLTTAEERQNQHRRASRAATMDAIAAREKLLTQHMRAVAAAARLKAGVEPKLGDVVVPGLGTPTSKLLVAAKQMVGDTKPYAGLIGPVVGHDFLDKLNASIGAVETARESGRANRAQRTVATSEVKRSLDLGRMAMRVLHPLVAEALEKEPSLLEEWNARRRKIRDTRPASPAAPEGEGTVGQVPLSVSANNAQSAA